MYEQLDIFSYLQPQEKEKYCFDDDINEIHEKLIEIANKYGIPIRKDEFTIWSHVPQYGYRMALEMKVAKEDLRNEDFQKYIDDIVEIAKEKEVDYPLCVERYFSLRKKKLQIYQFILLLWIRKCRKLNKSDWRKEVCAHIKAGFTPKDYDEISGIIRMVQADWDMSSMWNK